MEGDQLETPEKTSPNKDKNQLPQTEFTCHCVIFNSRIQIQATLRRGECLNTFREPFRDAGLCFLKCISSGSCKVVGINSGVFQWAQKVRPKDLHKTFWLAIFEKNEKLIVFSGIYGTENHHSAERKSSLVFNVSVTQLSLGKRFGVFFLFQNVTYIYTLTL